MKRIVIMGTLILTFHIGNPARAQMAPPEMEMKEVVVTATRQEEEVMRIPSHVTVITQEEIRQSNATHVGDLLRSEAGLWITNTSGSSPTGIFIDGRGFNNGGGNGSRILVLIDGRRANLVDTSNPDWSTIPVESIERIEIVRGSSTALYGDNAVAGVINIISRQGTGRSISEFTQEHGSFDYWKRKGSLSGTDGALSYYLYGGYESTDGYRDNSDYRASNYVGNFRYKMTPFTTLHFRSSYLSNERLLPGALTEDEIETVGRDGSVTPEDHGGTHQGQWDVGFDSFLAEGEKMELTGGQGLRSADTRITIPDAGFTDFDSDSRSSTVTGKYQTTARSAKSENRLIFGVDWLKETVNAETVNNYPDPSFPFVVEEETLYERRVIGAYAHDAVTLYSTWILTLAGRIDWSAFEFSRTETDLTANTTTRSSGDRSFRVWSPKAGLSYLMSPSTTFFLTWSKSFRFPNRDELTGIFGFTPELDPERAETYELGSTVRAGRAMEGTVSLFRMTVVDEILFVPPDEGEFAFGENQNVPEVRHDGVEVSTTMRYSKTTRVKVGYTATRTEIIEGPFEGNAFPITPKHAGSVTWDWGSGQGWGLSITGRFVGERHLANDLANTQEKLPSYTVVDTRLSYQGDHWDAFFGVNNALDKEYEDFGGVGGFPFGDRVGFNPAPERNYIGGITLRF
jgi:iron complex outermembrane receptor protein